MKKYRADLYNGEIEEREVIRETDKMIVYKCDFRGEQKETALSKYHAWFDSAEAAQGYLIAMQQAKIDQIESQLEYAKERLRKIKAL